MGLEIQHEAWFSGRVLHHEPLSIVLLRSCAPQTNTEA